MGISSAGTSLTLLSLYKFLSEHSKDIFKGREEVSTWSILPHHTFFTCLSFPFLATVVGSNPVGLSLTLTLPNLTLKSMKTHVEILKDYVLW